MRFEYRPIDRRNPESLVFEAYRRNVTSQNGEDGVISRVFKLIGTTNKVCVEFGAADGVMFSNTWSLVNEHGWSAILIEGRASSFAELQARYAALPKVTAINRYVDLAGNSLDQLLTSAASPPDPDFLSIDIDGLDWHVWHSLAKFRPRLVVIEFNPTIPNDVLLVPDEGSGNRQGCSLLALVELAREKGYELAATTNWNAFFVLRELFSTLGVADNAIDAIHRAHPYETKAFQLYDGSVLLVGNDRLLWQEGKIKVSGVIHGGIRRRRIFRSFRRAIGLWNAEKDS